MKKLGSVNAAFCMPELVSIELFETISDYITRRVSSTKIIEIMQKYIVYANRPVDIYEDDSLVIYFTTPTVYESKPTEIGNPVETLLRGNIAKFLTTMEFATDTYIHRVQGMYKFFMRDVLSQSEGELYIASNYLLAEEYQNLQDILMKVECSSMELMRVIIQNARK